MPWTRDAIQLEHYLDPTGNDCYRLTCPDGTTSTVSSAHLIEERITQLLRRAPECDPAPLSTQ